MVGLSGLLSGGSPLSLTHPPHHSPKSPHPPPPICPSGAKEAAELLSGCTADLKALRKLQRASASTSGGGGGGGDPQLEPAACAARTKQLLAAIGRTVDEAVER